MVASIPWLQSAINSFMNGIKIRYDSSQIPELFHHFKGLIIYLNVVILSGILISRPIMSLVSSAFTSRSVSLLEATKTSEKENIKNKVKKKNIRYYSIYHFIYLANETDTLNGWAS